MTLSLIYGNLNYALRKLEMKTRDAACLKVFCINAVPFNFWVMPEIDNAV